MEALCYKYRHKQRDPGLRLASGGDSGRAARAEPQELAETSVQRFFNHPTRHGAPELDTGRANAGRRESSPKERPCGGPRLGGLALSKAKQEN